MPVLVCISMCVEKYIGVHIYVYSHMSTCMWGPEERLRCCSSGTWSTLLRQGLLLTWILPSKLGRLASEAQGSLPFSAFLQHWDYNCMPPHLAAFYTGSGNQTQVFVLVRETFYQLSHLTSPYSGILYNVFDNSD